MLTFAKIMPRSQKCALLPAATVREMPVWSPAAKFLSGKAGRR